ncbi:hypothetical protein [Ekhidna sp.]|uniref:hypothetical protein n=1 Tax=Ekhidna sp. TaxID=2608089 RepID=UPI003B50FF6F
MKRLTKLVFSISIFLIGFNTVAKSTNTTDYLQIHSDIQVALLENDMRKAKSLIKTLLPMLDADIEYSKEILKVEDDEYFLNQINKNLERQEEIREKLEAFIKTRKLDKSLSKDSMNMVRELRRLSLQPKER